MTFRVKVISPIKIDEADLQRRIVRYGEVAGPDTQIQVCNLDEGPATLDTIADMVSSEYNVFREGAKTARGECDAILIDCVFDVAVDGLREHTGLPVFGPMRTTLPLVPLAAGRFSIISRSAKQCEMMADLVRKYGFGDLLASTRPLGLSYAEARKPSVFNAAMAHEIGNAIEQDDARAILMGSTTMAVTNELLEAAKGTPLFMPGLFALRIMETMWREGLLHAKSKTIP
ncbi:MAG: aspartate/glutamate racemase family protein [Chloroflexi bacterium]|nr:aspartate/glutamate racemase family protein [Chloroflexota bacterium]